MLRRPAFSPLRAPLLRLAVLSLAFAVLSGCYFPLRYDAEIRVDRRAFYSIIFDGYLTHATLFRDLRTGKITPEKEQEWIQSLENDFSSVRDPAVKEFEYLHDGIFKVHWEKSGDLTRHRMITFFRRNAAMLTLEYLRDKGQVVMRGATLSENQKQQIREIGLSTQGELRLITDAKIFQHNATEVRENTPENGETMYIWRLNSIDDPAPKLILFPG